MKMDKLKIRIRLKNSSKKELLFMLEPTGNFKTLNTDDEIILELEKQKDLAQIDIIFDDKDTIVFIENNNIFIDEVEDY